MATRQRERAGRHQLDDARGLALERGLARLSSAASDTPMRPSSVRAPVANTSALPCPLRPPACRRTPRRPRAFVHRQRLAGEQRLVERRARSPASRRASAGTRSPSARISRSPRTTSAPAMRAALAVAHHQRARARQVAQRLERALGLALLHHGDRDHHDDRGGQHQRLVHVADHEVERRRGDEQQEHRLAHHAERERSQAAPPGRRQRVAPFGGEARRRFGRAETSHTERIPTTASIVADDDARLI